MRMVLTAVSLLAIGLGGWLLLAGGQKSPRDAVIAHLTAITPSNAETRIALNGCHLVIDLTNPDKEGMIDRVNLSADLHLFNTEQIRIGQPQDGAATYLAPRIEISDAYLDQGLRLIEAAPPQLSNSGETLTLFGNGKVQNTQRIDGAARQIDRDKLREMLGTPNAKLVFGLSSTVSQRRNDGSWEDPQPHEHAPVFHDFVERVIALDPPATYLATRRYLGAGFGDRLLTGSLRLPGHIEFRFPDEDAVKSFAHALNNYKLTNCS